MYNFKLGESTGLQFGMIIICILGYNQMCLSDCLYVCKQAMSEGYIFVCVQYILLLLSLKCWHDAIGLPGESVFYSLDIF